MSDRWAVIQSIEPLVLVGLMTIGLLLVVSGLRSGRATWPRLRRLAVEEDGAAYTLSYVMVMPIYIALLCLIAQCGLFALAKIGTVYAAYSGARAAIVWHSIDAGLAAEKAQQAAVTAMVPFASGMVESQDAGFDGKDELLAAYEETSQRPAKRSYLEAKCRYAAAATQATLEVVDANAEPWQTDLAVTVRYEAPFLFPFLGPVLGGERRANGRYVYEVTSAAALQNEAPKNPDGRLGISYGSPD